MGLIIYWVAVAAVFYSAGVPTAHWRDADQFKPVGLQQLTLGGEPAPAFNSTQPDTTNMTTWVGGGCV